MNEQEEKQIANAFNAGYLMQQHEPQLLDKLLKGANANSEYMQAMAAGKKQQQKRYCCSNKKRSSISKIRNTDEVDKLFII